MSIDKAVQKEMKAKEKMKEKTENKTESKTESKTMKFSEESSLTFRKKYQIDRIFGAMAGAAIYSLGVVWFIDPVSLYSGGAMGFSQLIRTLLTAAFPSVFEGFDIAGIVYYAINVPLLLLGLKRIGKWFLFKTLLCVTTVTVLVSVIPVPAQSFLGEDVLASCVIGGILCGVGTGITLRNGGSTGGMDIVGMMLVRWRRDFKVGRVSMATNAVLYGICLFLFDIQTVIYSLIYAFVSSFAVDKTHSQTITVEIRVITKGKNEAMEQEIITEMNRGVTRWEAVGAFTQENVQVLFILASKYELNHIRSIIYKHDPKAFVMINEGVEVVGNYEMRV